MRSVVLIPFDEAEDPAELLAVDLRALLHPLLLPAANPPLSSQRYGSLHKLNHHHHPSRLALDKKSFTPKHMNKS